MSSDLPSTSSRKRTISELSASPPPSLPGSFPEPSSDDGPAAKRGKTCDDLAQGSDSPSLFGLGDGRDPSLSPRLSSQEKGKSRAMSPFTPDSGSNSGKHENQGDAKVGWDGVALREMGSADHPKEAMSDEVNPAMTRMDALVDDLEDELTCGMCAGLFVEPICLAPCGHPFCGSCVKLWLASFQLNPALSYSNPTPSLLNTLSTLRDRERYGDPGPSIGGVNGFGTRQAVGFGDDERNAEGRVIGGGVEAVRPTPDKGLGCPKCREPVLSGEGSGLIKGLVDVVLRHRPEIARPSDEILKANSIYKKGDLLSVSGNSAVTAAAKDQTPVLTSCLPPHQFPQPVRIRPNQILGPNGQPIRANADGTLNARGYWRPCPFCKPVGVVGEGSSTRYVCPVPIPDPTDPAQIARAYPSDGMVPDGHRMCSICEQLCPDGTAQQCNSCGQSACGHRLGCEIPKISELRLARSAFGALDSLTDSAISPTSRHWDQYLSVFQYNYTELAYFIGFVQKQYRRMVDAEMERSKVADMETMQRVAMIREPEIIEEPAAAGVIAEATVVAVIGEAGFEPVQIGDGNVAPVVAGAGQEWLVDADGDVAMGSPAAVQPVMMNLAPILQPEENVALVPLNPPGANPVPEVVAPPVPVASPEQKITTGRICREVVDWLLTPEALDLGGLMGMYQRADRDGATEDLPERLCKECGEDFFAAGVVEWWMREVKKSEVQERVPEVVRAREACKFGRGCPYQSHINHTETYSHLNEPLSLEEQAAKSHQVPPEHSESLASDMTLFSNALTAARAVFDLPLPASTPVVGLGANVNAENYAESDGGSDESDEDRMARPPAENPFSATAVQLDTVRGLTETVPGISQVLPQLLPILNAERRDLDPEHEDDNRLEHADKGVQTDPPEPAPTMAMVSVGIHAMQSEEAAEADSMEIDVTVNAPSNAAGSSNAMRAVRASTPLLSEVFGNRRSSPARFTSPSAELKVLSPRHFEYFNPSSRPGSPRAESGPAGSGQTALRGGWDELEMF